MPENYWNPDRLRLLEQLSSLDEGVSELYRAAIDLLCDTETPLNFAVKLITICHYMREVINALPEILGESPEQIQRGRLSNTKERDDLIRDCSEFFGPLDNYETPDRTNLSGSTTLPKQIVETLKAWTANEERITIKRRTRDAWLVDKSVNERISALSVLEKSRGFFMAYTHYRVGYVNQVSKIDDETILKHIDAFETIMRSRLGFFFEIQAELLTLIEEANRKSEVDGSYSPPTDKQIENASVRLAHPQQRRVFYSQLNNPLWVDPLFKGGLFSGPLGGEYWVEIDYLVRMSNVASHDVSSVLLSLDAMSNQFLRQGIVRSAASMNAVDAIELVNPMMEWTESPSLNNFVDPNDISTLIINLLSSRETAASGAKLAGAFYMPRKANALPNIGLPEPSFVLEEYFYAQTLPLITPSLGNLRVVLLQQWLEKYMAFSNDESAGPKHDLSYIWRPTILEAVESYSHVAANTLIDELKKALIESLCEGTKKWQYSIENTWPLIRRVAIAALLEFIEAGDIDLLDPLLKRQIVEAVEFVLSSNDFYRHSYAGEFNAFLRAVSQNNLGISLEPYFYIVRNDHPVYGRNGCAKDGFNDIEENRITFCEHWQHQYLSIVDETSLPADLLKLKEELSDKYGHAELKQHSNELFISVGTVSPLSLEEMKKLAPDDLLDHLKEWQPEDFAVGRATYDGQGRELGGLILEDPIYFETAKRGLVELKPIYIRAILSGWEYAVKAGKNIPWETAAYLGDWVLNEAEKPNENENPDDLFDDSSFNLAKSALANLLETASGSESSSCIDGKSLPIVLPCIVRLVSDPEPDIDFEEKYGGDNMDPLSLSLNSIRPIAVRALIQLSARFRSAPEAASILSALDDHFHDLDSSLAVAAAMGEGYPRLLDAHYEWAEERLKKVYGFSQPLDFCEQVSLSVSLYVMRPNIKLFETLRVPILNACIQMKDTYLISGIRDKTLPEQIGHWLIWLYIQGHIALDDNLMSSWFRNTDVGTREKVMSNMSWAVAHDTQVLQPEMIDNIMILWDGRFSFAATKPEESQELNGFTWIVHSRLFPHEWWIQNLVALSKVIPLKRAFGAFCEELIRAADFELEAVFTILEQQSKYTTQEYGEHYSVNREVVPIILAKVALCGDDELNKRAVTLMDSLGSQGLIDLREQVDACKARMLEEFPENSAGMTQG